MKVLKMTALLLFATATFCSVLYLGIDSPHARQVYTASNIWRISNIHGTGSASPVSSQRVNENNTILFLTAKHVTQGLQGGWRAYHQGRTLSGGKLIAEHPSFDVALLVFTVDTPVDIVPLTGRAPQFGERVWSVGYPRINSPVITEGIVSSHTIASTSSYYGCSGGAVIDSRGKIFGVVRAILRQTANDSSVVIPYVMLYTATVDIDSWLIEYHISH